METIVKVRDGLLWRDGESRFLFVVLGSRDLWKSEAFISGGGWKKGSQENLLIFHTRGNANLA